MSAWDKYCNKKYREKDDPKLSKKQCFLMDAMEANFLRTNQYICEYPELLKEVLRVNPNEEQHVPSEYITYELAIYALRYNSHFIKRVPPKMIDEEMANMVITQKGPVQYIPHDIWTQELAQKSATINGGSLQYIPVDLINIDIALAAVSNSGYALRFVPADLKTLKVVLISVASYGIALEYAPKFQNDIHVVKQAVFQNGLALQFASEQLRSKYEVVVAALRQNVNAIKYVSDDIKKNTYILLQIPNIYLCDEIISNREILLYGLQQCKWSISRVPSMYFNDKEVMLEIVKHCGSSLKYASAELCDDAYMVTTAVRNSEEALKYASARLKRDVSFLKKIVTINGLAIMYVSPEDQTYKLVSIAVEQDGKALLYCRNWRDNLEIVKKALITDGSNLQYATERHKNNKQLILEALKNASNVNLVVSGIGYLQNDKEIMLEAVRKQKSAIKYVSTLLREDPDIQTALKN